MAFLVAGTLQVASQVADAQESLGRKGKYSVKDPRVALALCSPEVSASTAALLEGVFQTLGFESCRRQEASIQGFRGELTRFREQLDAHGGSVGCAFVALVARPWQLRQSQQLVRELSRCKALWGRPKVFLLLSSAPGAVPEPGAFLASLGELCGRRPHWSLLQLLTEVFSRTAEESAGAAYCPVLRSSLRGALCLGNVEPWGPEGTGMRAWDLQLSPGSDAGCGHHQPPPPRPMSSTSVLMCKAGPPGAPLQGALTKQMC
ncbi:uncharacterized protein [Bos mutus]|uniref:uncharacterized protein isoform X3 n=1 Tax=Bos mutus TaxID=72004 RepID=UPI0038B58AE4